MPAEFLPKMQSYLQSVTHVLDTEHSGYRDHHYKYSFVPASQAMTTDRNSDLAGGLMPLMVYYPPPNSCMQLRAMVKGVSEAIPMTSSACTEKSPHPSGLNLWHLISCA